MSRKGFPSYTTDEMFLWMAKHLGQHILLFDVSAPDRKLLLRDVFPCVVHREDFMLRWLPHKLDEAAMKLIETPICIAYANDTRNYRLLRPGTKGGADVYEALVGGPPPTASGP